MLCVLNFFCVLRIEMRKQSNKDERIQIMKKQKKRNKNFHVSLIFVCISFIFFLRCLLGGIKKNKWMQGGGINEVFFIRIAGR